MKYNNVFVTNLILRRLWSAKFILRRGEWSAKFILPRSSWSAKFILLSVRLGMSVLYPIGKRYIIKIQRLATECHCISRNIRSS